MKGGAHEVLLHGGKRICFWHDIFLHQPCLFVQGVSFQWGVDSPPGFPLACPALGLGEVLQVALHVQVLCLMGLVLPIGEQVGVDWGVVPWVFGTPPCWLGVGAGLMCLHVVPWPFL